jgi:hypothetical protein
LFMLIFSTSHGKMIAWLFVLQKAKHTRWGETAIRFGISMPRQIILVFAPFSPLQRMFLPIPVSQMWRTSQRLARTAIFLVVFSPWGISTGGSWIASDELLRRIRMCFLDLEFAPVIWAHILHGRGHAVLPLQEALSAHQWSPFACGQCGVWGWLRSATSSSKKPGTSTGTGSVRP